MNRGADGAEGPAGGGPVTAYVRAQDEPDDQAQGQAPEGPASGGSDAPVILASASPRRRRLLQYLVDDFQVEVADVDESLPPGAVPKEAVQELAARKAEAVSAASPDAVVLGADTLLEHDSIPLGKPEDEDHLRIMLLALMGRTHTVWTGVAVARGGRVLAVDAARSQVTLDVLPAALLDAYASSSAWQGKAGGYGIQDPYLRDHLRLEGSWSNVVGLPLAVTRDVLSAHGVACRQPPSEAALQEANPF